MKKYIKYICAILLVIGTSAHAWSETVSQTIPWATSGTFDSNISWHAYKGAGTNAPYITSESKLRLYKNTSNQGGGLLNITAKNGCVITSITITFSSGTCGYRLSDATYNGKKSDYTACSSGSAIAFSNVTAVQFANIDADNQLDVVTVSVTYTPACTAYDITLSGDPAGTLTDGTISSSASSACEGVAVLLTATPSAGYSFSSWTITKTSNGNDVTASVLDGNTLTMPDYGVTVNATFAPQTYTVTLNSNGGSGSNQTVTATYSAAMPTTLSGGGAIVIPTRTGYTFDGWVKNSDGTGTQYYTSSATSNHIWDIANNTTIYAKWIANTISITLDKNGGDANGSASIKYDATTLTSRTDATRSEWNVVGYYAEPACTNKVLTNTGLLVNYTGYVEGGKWVRATTPTTLYAKWSKTQYTVTFKMNGHGDAVPAQEVESGDPAVRPTPDPSADDWRFLGWYDAASGGSEWNFSTGITGNTTIHAHWEEISYDPLTYKAWCEPNISFSGDIHLTSVNGVSVYSTSTTSNLLHIISDDLAGVNKLEITYLDADNGDAVVAKESSLFRLCNDGSENYNLADGSQIDVSGSNTCDLTYSIRYTPNAPEVTNHYKIQIAMKRGSGPSVWTVKTATYNVYGRSLPTEFVVASKFNGEWYALPNTLETTEVAAKAVEGIKITVDNTTTPTKAVYAPNTAVYQGEGRYAAGTNVYGIRLTDGTNHLQVSSTASVNYMWLSPTGSAAHQDWWLSSSDFGAYTVTIPSTGTKKMGIVGGHIGYFASPTSPSDQIYFLPIENTLIDIPAKVTEWGQHSVILDVDAQTASSASARIGVGASENAASFGQTLTSVKSAASKYNYTLSFNTMDFSTHKDELLYIDWLDGEDNVIGTSQINIPWIIASTGTMSAIDGTKGHWDTEVHVLPGATLTADGGSFSSSSVTIKQLEIYPSATVKVTTGTLTATTLSLRNGWTRAGSKKYDVARLYIDGSANLGLPTNAYADWYIDYDQYYPVAVPWSVTTSSMSYLNTTNSASAGVKLRYYDGASRAENGQTGVADGANWKEYSPLPATLTPGLGYAMTARRPTGKAFSIVRMPLTIPSAAWTTGGEKGYVSTTHKDQVTVTAHGADAEPAKPTYLVGWNFIANPYMANYQGTIEYADGDKINVVNIPDVSFNEYGQYATATTKLAPASGFLIQAPKDGTLTFGTANRKNAAPAYRNAKQADAVPEQQAYILLKNESAEDMMGLFVSEKYTADYDLNGDVEKLLSSGTSLRTYMRYRDMNMAYVAINETLAKEWIPVTIRIPEAGEFSFSIHEASIAGELQGVYLIDYENGDKVTNLLEENYPFYSEAGTISGRFAINAVIGKRLPTDIDAVNTGTDNTKPVKFIYRENVYILLHGVIYDATGKKVREINK